MAKEGLHLRIHGRVQGVFFRASTRARAERLSLTGWVRNCPDGTVELHAEGPRDSLIALREWCRRGPEGAQVTEINETWTEACHALDGGFSIHR